MKYCVNNCKSSIYPPTMCRKIHLVVIMRVGISSWLLESCLYPVIIIWVKNSCKIIKRAVAAVRATQMWHKPMNGLMPCFYLKDGWSNCIIMSTDAYVKI